MHPSLPPCATPVSPCCLGHRPPHPWPQYRPVGYCSWAHGEKKDSFPTPTPTPPCLFLLCTATTHSWTLHLSPFPMRLRETSALKGGYCHNPCLAHVPS